MEKKLVFELKQEDVLEGLRGKIDDIYASTYRALTKAKHEIASGRRTIEALRPDLHKDVISVSEHRKALRTVLISRFLSAEKQGRDYFVLILNTDEKDEKGNPEDESGSHYARALYCKNILQTQGIQNVLVFNKFDHSLLVVVI